MSGGRRELWRARAHVAQLRADSNVPGLIAELDNPLEGGRTAIVRADAAVELGELGDVRAVPYLLPLMSDPSEPVRTHVIRALGRLPTEEAISAIRTGLRDTGPLPRMASVRILGELRVIEAADELRALAKGDAEPWVRLSALKALSELGEELSDAEIATSLRNVPWRLRRRRAWRRQLRQLEGARARAARSDAASW